MQLAEVRTLFAYDAWASERILDQAGRLTPEQYVEPSGAGAQSIRQIVTHMLIARHLWRVRLETGTSELGIGPEDFPTFAAFRAGWQEELRRGDAYLATLDDQALTGQASYERQGETRTFTRWHILYQLLFHNAQHRAEVAERLTGFGYSPGDLDFFLYIATR